MSISKSNVIQEFSRFAHQYDQYNVIQSQVASTLVKQLKSNYYKNVLDIGSGSGEVFKNFQKEHITCEQFIALDSAETMLSRHPLSPEVTTICANFNQADFCEKVPVKRYELLISSSALQWSENLAFTFSQLSKLSQKLHASFFTSGTFKTLHETAGLNSPIYAVEKIEKTLKKFYNIEKSEVRQYRLEFESTREMFRYIKQSGVSAGERKLGFKETKSLMEKYPLNYLEFEVLFIEGKVL